VGNVRPATGWRPAPTPISGKSSLKALPKPTPTPTRKSRAAIKKKPSREIIINQIRILPEFIGISSHRGGPKVILIHPAETLNINAANALPQKSGRAAGPHLFPAGQPSSAFTAADDP